jgi:hypothetical protein
VKSSSRPVARKRRSTARSRKAARTNGRASSTSTTKLLNQGKQAFTGAYDQAVSAGRSLRSSIGSSRWPSVVDRRKSITSMIEENPLVMGAVGLGIGMVLGAMMPSVDMRSMAMGGRGNQKIVQRRSSIRKRGR